MRKIRNEVFETNSSSIHTITIASYESDNYEHEKNYLRMLLKKEEIPLGKFGWGEDLYVSSYGKLQYALTMVFETELTFEEREENPDKIYETNGYKEIFDLLHEECGINDLLIDSFDGYIDHQSCEYYHSLDDFLKDWDMDLYNFIFNENITLYISNDNK